MLKFFRRVFGSESKPVELAKEEERPVAKIADPLDPIQKLKEWDKEEPSPVKFRSVKEFPVFNSLAGEHQAAFDSVSTTARAKLVETGAMVAMDDDSGMLKEGPSSEYTVPAGIQQWYMSQGFIGYQSCAIIAQHWLVDKACSMSGEDAARNGWTIKARGGKKLESEESELIKQADKRYALKHNLVELNRFKNVFGIRVAIFKVKSTDPLYYEKPFNLDGITPDSYEGISQVDPYWMMPVMTTKGTSDPSSIGFYDPEFWVISGKKYHKSHLVIARGPQPADILKPTYIFGGMPLTQRIYERVYAAERTANESPLLAMSKRTTAIHVDMERALADQSGFERRLMMWIHYRDNHGVKVLGKEEAMEQFDTNLSDFDSLIMNQYQLVSAIARTPSTKLLGTSPKGFNATGEFEMRSYHEELESVQEHVFMPLLERHYDILGRSLGLKTNLEVVCNAVDSMTAKERAELNYTKAQTNAILVNDIGAVSPDEVRETLREDEHSGFNELADADANETPGLSPDNIAAFQKAGAQQQKGTAAEATAGLPTSGNSGAEGTQGEEDDFAGAAGTQPGTMAALMPMILQQMVQGGAGKSKVDPMQAMMLMLMHQLAGKLGAPDDVPAVRGTAPGTIRTVKPTVKRGEDSGVIGKMKADRLPKMRVAGLNLVIENPRGTFREGVNLDGSEWSVEMPHHYGYIKGYDGADGDEVDCFVGPNMRSKDVYVITQNNEHGEFDEYKCMIGFDDEQAAIAGYNDSFTDGWDGFGACQRMSIDDFKNWLDAGMGAGQVLSTQQEG
jgi:phage-related protein (TIGR01555 family)